ncbi:hypothetical protein [Pseudoalteromonas denitrificans]|nr:hypothetical protein [Pseudoalteromonas denitrificans]
MSLGKNETDYIKQFKQAKMFAVGFDSNDFETDFKADNISQDTCLDDANYRQDIHNKNLRIPEPEEAPEKIFNIPSYVYPNISAFSMGELTALYGDYKMLPRCTTDSMPLLAVCFLSIGADEYLTLTSLEQNYNPSIKSDCLNEKVTQKDYLKHLASGIEAPHGYFGNLTSNSERSTDYQYTAWWGDEMMRLAMVNQNHFSKTGLAVYIGLHRSALEFAVKAKQNAQYWTLAMHYEAAALHSLTDLFAFGHNVVDRSGTSNKILDDTNMLNIQPVADLMEILHDTGIRHDGPSNGILDGLNRVTFMEGKVVPGYLDNSVTRSDQMGYLPQVIRPYLRVRSLGEKDNHDTFNLQGAWVKNYRGDLFRIYGDGKYNMEPVPGEPVDYIDDVSKSVISNAVTASIQSLINAHRYGLNAVTPGHVGAEQNFEAIAYLPYWVRYEKSHNYDGYYFQTASVIDAVLNRTGESHPANCIIPPFEGVTLENWDKDPSHYCAEYSGKPGALLNGVSLGEDYIYPQLIDGGEHH